VSAGLSPNDAAAAVRDRDRSPCCGRSTEQSECLAAGARRSARGPRPRLCHVRRVWLDETETKLRPMASRIVIDPADLMQEHLRASRWEEAVALYERGLGREDRQELATRLAYAIALVRVGRAGSGVNLLTPELLGLPN